MNAVSEVNEVNRIQALEAALERETKSAMFWCDMAAHFEAALDTKEHIIETLTINEPLLWHQNRPYTSQYYRRTRLDFTAFCRRNWHYLPGNNPGK